MQYFLSLVCWMGLLFVQGDQNPKPQTLTAAEAQNHIGDTATVCGKVVGARVSKYAVGDRGRPIFLDLDKPEPNPTFLIVTWAEDGKPAQPEPAYLGKHVCATGKIVKERGIPQIITTKSSQTTVQPEEKKDEKKQPQ